MRKKLALLISLVLLLELNTAVQAAAPVTSGLVLHLDANAITGLNNGDTVTTWADISGSGNSATAIGDPSYHTGVINGKPVVRLDGDDSFLSPLSTTMDMSIFVVTKGTSYQSLVRWQYTSWLVYHWGGLVIQKENGYPAGPATGLVTGQWNIGALIMDTGPANGVNTYRNGTLHDTYTFSNNWGPISNLYIGSLLGGGEFMTGDIAEILIYNHVLSESEHNLVGAYLTVKYNITTTYDTSVYNPNLVATNPSPSKGKTFVDRTPTLSWTPGEGIVLHEVYLGTDYNDVNDANSTSHPNVDYNNVDVNSYQPGLLDIGQKYYWRVDEVNEPNVWKGDIWNFTITPKNPAIAKEPRPVDFGEGVDPNNTVLTWKPGLFASTHDVYFSADFNDVNEGEVNCPTGDIDKSRQVNWFDIYYIHQQWLTDPNGGISADLNDDNDVDFVDFAIVANDWQKRAVGNQDSNSYDPGILTADQTHYWRIDEVNNPNVWRGNIWSFTTCDYSLDFGLQAPEHLFTVSVSGLSSAERWPVRSRQSLWMYRWRVRSRHWDSASSSMFAD
ncbi:MAG: hypothetical protein NTW55_05965 [Planctomycetota bacterium]|nr:hypothetical protein [Planctomycetota bacterium]